MEMNQMIEIRKFELLESINSEKKKYQAKLQLDLINISGKTIHNIQQVWRCG
jgi:uncharacterized protein YajQ (UPF0234 family)